MVVVTSNGMSSSQLLGEVSELTKNMSTAVIVTTASNPLGGDNDLPRLKLELEKLYLKVDWFDFDRDTPDRLLQYDVVEMSGGDPFYLRESIHKANAESLLRAVADNRILIGVSAGAIVQQKDMSLLARFSQETKRKPTGTLMGIGIVNHEIMPHYKQFCERFFDFEERIRQYEVETGKMVIRLNDGDGRLISKESLL